MSQSTSISIYALLALAFCLANLPFVNQRLFAVVALKAGKTPLHRLGELVVWFFVAGAVGLALEQHAGQIAKQQWEFYAILATLFVTFAFPGFVYRYLLRHDTPRHDTPGVGT